MLSWIGAYGAACFYAGENSLTWTSQQATRMAMECGLCRAAATRQAGSLVVERADAVDEKHVQVDVEVESAWIRTHHTP